MSVHTYSTNDGARYQVRWREAQGRVRTRVFTSKREANAFDAEIKARKFKGDALPRPGKDTLSTAYDDWFRLRGSTLATTTQATYRAVWNAHVRGRFDHHRLNELSADPQLFEELLADMRARRVGPAAQRKVLVVMSAVLTACVDWKKISVNPVLRMRKPSATPQRHPHPFPPLVVERIRLRMERRQTLDNTRLRAIADGCLVTLMSYAGLRPGEALALTWGDVGTHTLAIDKAMSDGKVGATKTRAMRTVPLLGPLRSDLEALRWAADLPGEERFVIPSSNGGPWSDSEFRNWRHRVWKPIVRELSENAYLLARLASARPYDCRGTFVSLHLRGGASPLEVAKWAGHSPAVMFKHYANVIEELQGEPLLPAEEQIARAREAVEKKARAELDNLTAGLLVHPTISAAEREHRRRPEAGPRPSAARVLYDPDAAP